MNRTPKGGESERRMTSGTEKVRDLESKEDRCRKGRKFRVENLSSTFPNRRRDLRVKHHGCWKTERNVHSHVDQTRKTS